MKPYLICLEIQPVEVARRYGILPLHCTLVHWFWLPEGSEAFDEIERLVATQAAPKLLVEQEDNFTATTASGPLPVRVSRVQRSANINTLHEMITEILENYDAHYVAPKYIHDGYAPHITHQRHKRVDAGDELMALSLYIVSAKTPEYGNTRRVIRRLKFKD